MKITVNKLTIDKVEEFSHKLLEIAEQTIDYPNQAIDYYRNTFSPEAIRLKLDNSVALYIQKKEEIVAVLFGSMPEGGVATIIWLLVDKDLHGLGYGRRLFDEAKKNYTQLATHKIKLTVPNQNTISFYKKLGMTEEGVHPNHWWNMTISSMGLVLK
jgi:ribosomal protein S18 acetylase RimI-like enzyme